MPYIWLNNVLVWLGLGALGGAVALVAAAIVRGKGKRKRLLLGTACCLVAFLLLAAANYALLWLVQLPSLGREWQHARQERAAAASHAKLGDMAPLFRIKTISGSEFAPTELRGKVVLLDFFATWCGPCNKELPYIQELWKEYGDRNDFVLLVLGRDESEQSIRAFVSKHGYSFPVAADPERAVFSLYAKELIPRTYLIASDGTICHVTTGFNDDDIQSLKQAVAQQLRVKE